jgi:hypothetical protein
MRDPNEQHTRTELLDIAGQMKDVLAARFDPHSLLLRQITHTSPPAVLQKVRTHAGTRARTHRSTHAHIHTRVQSDAWAVGRTKVVETESVHPLGSVDQFLARLGKGRKCYAFFHPLLPEVLINFKKNELFFFF